MRSFGICNLSVIPLRAEASDKSEIMTHLLFGDHFEVLESLEKWVYIKTAFDDYEGWIDPKQYAVIDLETFVKMHDQHVLTHLLTSQPLRLSNGELINLVPGSILPFFEKGRGHINSQQYEFSGDTLIPDQSKFKEGVEAAAKFYLHTPYLWGGKSTFGIDCSGLTQMVFKHFGIKIRRDAWQQAEQGDTVNFLQEAALGDLAFFDNAEGRIIHVGILLSPNQIIHASGRVKIDSIDDQGIFSSELNRYTHKLRIIKRYHQQHPPPRS